jgi:hypothetical protein
LKLRTRNGINRNGIPCSLAGSEPEPHEEVHEALLREVVERAHARAVRGALGLVVALDVAGCLVAQVLDEWRLPPWQPPWAIQAAVRGKRAVARSEFKLLIKLTFLKGIRDDQEQTIDIKIR